MCADIQQKKLGQAIKIETKQYSFESFRRKVGVKRGKIEIEGNIFYKFVDKIGVDVCGRKLFFTIQDLISGDSVILEV